MIVDRHAGDDGDLFDLVVVRHGVVLQGVTLVRVALLAEAGMKAMFPPPKVPPRQLQCELDRLRSRAKAVAAEELELAPEEPAELSGVMVGVREAASLTGLSERTMRRRHAEFGGRLVGGAYVFDRALLVATR